jgi:hypothetical protein
MRNIGKYADNETYVMPENAHIQRFTKTDHTILIWPVFYEL